ncbi:MAG TPA: hypothetical protein VGN32_19735 [Ktedonobacterales bacterium]|nr:hypothetical protein [Ktedonobacterales bacterium]
MLADAHCSAGRSSGSLLPWLDPATSAPVEDMLQTLGALTS